MVLKIVAHRGASHDEAEHTLGAYVAAMDAGSDGLECDVRLTADNHLVCVHDRHLRKIGARGLVSTMELADLAELDFAAWKRDYWELDDEAPDRDSELDRVLTLRTLLETARDYRRPDGRPVEVAIETKHPTRYGGLVERKVAELLGEFGWAEAGSPARVMSFSFTALQRFDRLAPGLKRVQIFDHSSYWPMLRRAIGKDWIVAPGMEELRAHPKLGRRVVGSGHEMHVWTVNTEADVRLCQELGASTVITDRPDFVRRLLGAG